MKRLAAILGLLWCLNAPAAEVIPPSPARYFNDYANAVSSGTAGRLNKQLEDFERQSSCQIVVAVYPKMQSDSSIEDYAVRVFRAWGVGQKDKNNGALLMVFVQDHKMRIATGYGLEGAMPDALCKRILDDEITPRFKSGDFDGGLSAGVTAMMAAAKGEYKGTGHTVADATNYPSSRYGWFDISWRIGIGLFIVYLLIRGFVQNLRTEGRGWMMGSSGYGRSRGGGGFFLGGGGGGFSSGGGGFSGGGGGFSGGGGSTGGGGASGGW